MKYLGPIDRRKRDWFEVLRILMRYGISMRDVARACGRHELTVKHWQSGVEPKESDARVMLSLMAKHAPKEYREHQMHFEIVIGDGGTMSSLREGVA